MAAPRNYEELMSRLPAAAVAISGAHHSSYTGYVDNLMLPESITYARTDGVIEYREDVSSRLRDLLDGNADEKNLNALWEALRNNAIVLSPAGRDYPDAGPMEFDPADLGSHPAHAFADAFTDYHLPLYVSMLELESRVPGIQQAADRHFAPAALKSPGTDGAAELAAYIADRTGTTPHAVLRQINNQTPGGCLREAARQLAVVAGVPADLSEPARQQFAEQHGVDPQQVRDSLEKMLADGFHKFPGSTAYRATAPAPERPELAELMAEVNSTQAPAGRPLPPRSPSWRAEDLINQVEAAVTDWQRRLGGVPESARPADAWRAVALAGGTSPLDRVRTSATGAPGQAAAPAPDAQGRRAGAGPHGPHARPGTPDRTERG